MSTVRRASGLAARRAIVRWAWRMFRREWRQQVLVLALLTVAVGAAVAGATAAYNTAGVSGTAEMGTANHMLRLPTSGASDASTTSGTSGSEPWREAVAAAEGWFGTVEVIRHWYASVPGSAEDVELRAQDPRGAFGHPTLTLLDGRYPRRGGEVAVTDWVAETFGLRLGSMLGVDGVERAVVGLVENPHDLHAEFALVPPTDPHAADAVTLLVRASDDHFDAFPATRELTGDDGELMVANRRDDEDVLAALAALGVASLALVLVALIASAGFVVLAQRRLRQLGMLAVVGATGRHLRLVMVANGVAVGAVAGLAGTVLGLAGWLVVEPRLEDAAAHRIDPLHLPWWLLAAAALLAVAMATAAAWWPARMAARVPVVRALSGRPPRPTSIRSSAGLAGALLALGLVCLARSDRSSSSLLVVAGTVATVAGVLLAGPLAIRVAARVAGWLPVAVRLALRDLARFQARSGMALAAISLVLGVPVAVVVTAAAAEPRAGEGNLAGDQLLVRMGDPDEPDAACPGPVQAGGTSGILGGGNGPCPYIPDRSPADLAGLEATVDRIAAHLDEPSVLDLEVAFDPTMPPGPDGRTAVTLAQPMGAAGEGGDGGLLDISLLYVATPELLAHYGIEPREVDPGTELLTVESGELWFVGFTDRDRPGRFDQQPVREVERLEPGYSSLPGSLVTRTALQGHGWRTAPAGWLVEAGSPVTDEQFDAARDLAAEADLIVEARDEREGLAALRTRATVAAVVLALVVLAMTVGLIRTEAAGDLRTLSATGATSTVRRTLTAGTAGSLALLGALLGSTGAYLALATGFVDDVGTLGRVPVVHLAAIAVGLPVVAAGAGWLLAGREPPTLTRQPID